jgi:amidase
MKLTEYAAYDALGLGDLVNRGEVTPRELAATAMEAIEAVDPTIKAVVETYPDRIENLDESSLGTGPFRGVPFLIKDIFGHEAGRKIEFGSRLCRGMCVEQDTYLAHLLRASGLNIMGRSNAPEYSMAGTAENALYGNTSTPWKEGYSAGGSTGGGMAAVVAGMVPIAHGTDIAGSIRIPASWCGGVGLKPSRGRISFGPVIDENGFGLASHFVQTKTVRDTAAMLDCLAIPQTGDPFLIPKPEEPYAVLSKRPPGKLRIGWSVEPIMGVPVESEVAAAVSATAGRLAKLGHEVNEESPQFDGLMTLRRFADIWFFALDARLQGYAKKSGNEIGPETLEPVILKIYEYSRTISPADFVGATLELNAARRKLAAFFDRYDIWLSPTTARVSEPHGRYSLGRTDVGMDNIFTELFAAPFQFTVPHNIMGTPAISLPLGMTSNQLPIGVQLGARPAQEHLLLQLATILEDAMPWHDRVPPLHVTQI